MADGPGSENYSYDILGRMTQLQKVISSTTAITTASGAVCYQANFTPYGEEHLAQTTTCPQNYKFTGYERDSETGLDYAFARYYDSRLARFLSADPLHGGICDPQSLNGYAYVGNSPLNFTDPSGLKLRCQGDARSNVDSLCGWGLGDTGSLGTGWNLLFARIPLRGDWAGLYAHYGIGTTPETLMFNPPLYVDSTFNGDTLNIPLLWEVFFVDPQSTASVGGPGRKPVAPQSQAPKQLLLVCAAETANKYSLAQLAGTNGMSGFFNNLANGVLGNAFSTVASYAYGGSNVEAGTTAYDLGTKATEGAINAATGAAPITELGLGAESAAQISEGIATEGLRDYPRPQRPRD